MSSEGWRPQESPAPNAGALVGGGDVASGGRVSVFERCDFFVAFPSDISAFSSDVET